MQKLLNRFKLQYHHLVYATIFLIALALRAYKLKERFPFTMDEEYQAFLVNNILTKGHIPLIGVNVADTGLYLGPLFTWISTIPYTLANLHPIGTAWAAAILGSITAVVIIWATYLIAKTDQPKDDKPHKITHDAFLPATLAGIFYAINPLINMYDRKYWNPSFVPLLAIIWYLAIIRYQKNPRWLLVIAVVFGLAFHTHYSLFILIPATVVMVLKKQSQDSKQAWHKHLISKLKIPTFKRPTKLQKFYHNNTLMTTAILLLCISPLLIFELRHGFIQTKGFINRYTNPKPAEYTQTIPQKLQVFHQGLDRLYWLGFNKDIAEEITLCPTANKTIPIIPFSIIIPITLYILYRKKRFSDQIIITSTILISYLTFLLTYHGPFSEYYLLPLLPIVLINTALLFENKLEEYLIHRVTTYGLYLAIIILSLCWIVQSIQFTNHMGLAKKEYLIDYAKSIVGNNYYHLNSVGTCYKYEGYRYLSQVMDFNPTTSYMDAQFSWLYPDLPQTSPDMEVIFASAKDPDQTEWLRQKELYGYFKTVHEYGDINILIRKVD